MDSNNFHTQIDLKEIIASFWAYKFLILLIILASVVIGTKHALDKEKIYSAYAIFKLDAEDNKEIAKVPSIASLSVQAPNKLVSLKEYVMSRVFIDIIDKESGLKSDPYFNRYNPNSVEAPWRAFIKKHIGLKTMLANKEDKIWESIQLNYTKNINLQITKAQNLKISVDHSDPRRAADIANKIMNIIISRSEAKKSDKLENQIDYLSLKLADALQDIEKYQEELNAFTINNTIMPKEIFASASAVYVKMKSMYDQNNKLYNATEYLEKLVHSNQTSTNNYKSLRKNHPIVDELEFRRIFGQSELISEWSWPTHASTIKVLKILHERKSRLKSSLTEAQDKADNAANSLNEYIDLERKLKYGNATYTVLLEQVKSDSLSAGYQPNDNEIFQYASAPINATSPNKKLILSLSILLGLITGLISSLILSISRKVYFSDSLLISHSNSKQNMKLKKLKKYQYKNFETLSTIKKEKILSYFQEILISFNKSNKKFILISSLNSSFKAENFTALLAHNIDESEKDIAILNFSQNSDLDKNKSEIKNELFSSKKINGHITQLIPINCFKPITLLTKRGAVAKLFDLKSSFDVIIISADKNDTYSLIQSFNSSDVFHIGLAKRKHTKRIELNKIKHIPLDILLHD